MNTLRLIADCQLQAAAKDAPRRFKVDPAYSGGSVPGYTARVSAPVVIDLATLAPRNGNVIANLDHKQDARVGHVDEIQNDGRVLKLAGVVSAATAAADEFLSSASGGFPWSASIEAELPKLERVERGQSVKVNHQSFTGPLFIARGAKLTAVAFVSVGADASARAFAASRKGRSMDPYLSAEAEAEIRQRIDGVQLQTAQCRDTLHDIEARALSGELDGLQMEREISHLQSRDKQLHELRAARPTAGMFPQGANKSTAANAQVIVAALCLQGGLSNPEKHFEPRLLDAADRVPAGLGLQQLLMSSACDNGYQAGRGEYVTQGNIRSILTAAFRPDFQATGFTTISLPGILGATANKFLLEGWQEMGDEWRSISQVKPVRDFKANTFYRMLDSMQYEEVGPTGELKHGTLGEQSMSVSALTYGKIMGITRTQIINDDLDAFSDIPRRLGRAAAEKFRRVFWAAFLATSDNFFSAGNNNVLTGSGTALTETGTALQNALTAFRAQRTSTTDGAKMIGGKPATMMVPGSLGIIARRLLNSSNIVSGSTSMVPSGNPFQGIAELVEVDWLEDSSFTGYSAAKWYLFRSPNLAPAMLVAFLNGRESPTVETAEADFNQLGISMRGYHDWGVGRGEPLCGLQVAGTPA